MKTSTGDRVSSYLQKKQKWLTIRVKVHAENIDIVQYITYIQTKTHKSHIDPFKKKVQFVEFSDI